MHRYKSEQTPYRHKAILAVADDAVEHGVELAVVGVCAAVRRERRARLARARQRAPARHRRAVHARAAAVRYIPRS